MSIRIIKPGSLSTIQDLGRTGYEASGFSPSGAADRQALKDLNMLLGNTPGEAAVEMTLSGMIVEFDQSCVFAVTGANDMPTLNGTDIPLYRAIEAKAGDTLAFGFAQDGVRTYFGVSGGFDIPLVMGSRSTGIRFSIGGFDGRKLMEGDRIAFRNPVQTLPDMDKRHLEHEPILQNLELRVVSGPQDAGFLEEQKQTFYSSTYQVSGSADRMGIRLNGPVIRLEYGTDIISDATADGAIQIVNGGLPIILLQDRQTTGGYAKIACIISADLPKAGQLRPGAEIRFSEVSVQDAQRILKKQNKAYITRYKAMNGRRPV